MLPAPLGHLVHKVQLVLVLLGQQAPLDLRGQQARGEPAPLGRKEILVIPVLPVLRESLGLMEQPAPLGRKVQLVLWEPLVQLVQVSLGPPVHKAQLA